MANVAEAIAKKFHETYEEFSPSYGIPPREKPLVWEDVPRPNRELLIAIVAELIDQGVIESGESL